MLRATFPGAPRVAAGPPWCRDPARSDIETPLSAPVFVVRLHKTQTARLPGPSRRGQCGQANERDIGLVVVTSRSVVIGARGEAPVGQHAYILLAATIRPRGLRGASERSPGGSRAGLFIFSPAATRGRS